MYTLAGGGKTYPKEVGGCARDGWIKGRNKKSRSHGGDDVVVDDYDDDDGVSGSRLVDADVPAPGVLFSAFFFGNREKTSKRGKSTAAGSVVSRVLRHPPPSPSREGGTEG